MDATVKRAAQLKALTEAVGLVGAARTAAHAAREAEAIAEASFAKLVKKLGGGLAAAQAAIEERDVAVAGRRPPMATARRWRSRWRRAQAELARVHSDSDAKVAATQRAPRDARASGEAAAADRVAALVDRDTSQHAAQAASVRCASLATALERAQAAAAAAAAAAAERASALADLAVTQQALGEARASGEEAAATLCATLVERDAARSSAADAAKAAQDADYLCSDTLTKLWAAQAELAAADGARAEETEGGRGQGYGRTAKFDAPGSGRVLHMIIRRGAARAPTRWWMPPGWRASVAMPASAPSAALLAALGGGTAGGNGAPAPAAAWHAAAALSDAAVAAPAAGM
jgi:SWI/SNF-related matrix-associated actin-dependent regulator 1 of chromatin subfamily A